MNIPDLIRKLEQMPQNAEAEVIAGGEPCVIEDVEFDDDTGLVFIILDD